jgi:hypothetical protein
MEATMAFRADEEARYGYDCVLRYLVNRDLDDDQKERSKETFARIIEECGPVVDGYPSWHPLVSNHDDQHPQTTPGSACGYTGLDHTRYFVNGFITCPYGDGQDVLDSVAQLPYNHIARITAERLDVQLYQPNATPILVKCNWGKPLLPGEMIPTSLAIPLILEKELPGWKWARYGETWETMQPYLLGTPHGSRSSLFVTQETGQTIKKVWNLLINTGMFGPIKV